MRNLGQNKDIIFEHLRSRYRDFAENEAKGVSSLYQQLAWAVTKSDLLLHFIASLPPQKQQPNLVFAAVRYLYGTPIDDQHFAQLIEQHRQSIRDLILLRMTQTNEPGRCATLLPALARLPQPLALLEVGASAGLCLLVDQWGYDYGGRRLEPRCVQAHQPPIFPCRVDAATPLPYQIPAIVWRVGIDLHPIDLTQPEEVAWLETFVWPGQEERAERLRAAIRVAQDNPPAVMKGNLLTDLAPVASSAPAGATLVIFHSAVLPYLTSDEREQFIRTVTGLEAVWISNEAPQAVPMIAAKLRDMPPEGTFLLAINGEPVAFTSPHGQSMNWLN